MVTINVQNVQTKPMRPLQGILFGVIFAIVGICILLFSVLNIRNYNQKNETYIETTSKVVDYAYNDEGLEAIIVEYTVDGQSYRKTSNSYSNMPKSKGSEVMIKYNPDNPSDVIWVKDSANIVLPLLGGLFTLVGIIIFVINVKKVKTQKDTPTAQQSNSLYNGDAVINSFQNTQNATQQNPQFQQIEQSQINQPQQFSQPQQNVNQVQNNVIQNNNYPNYTDNQNNTNSNL